MRCIASTCSIIAAIRLQQYKALNNRKVRVVENASIYQLNTKLLALKRNDPISHYLNP